MFPWHFPKLAPGQTFAGFLLDGYIRGHYAEQISSGVSPTIIARRVLERMRTERRMFESQAGRRFILGQAYPVRLGA